MTRLRVRDARKYINPFAPSVNPVLASYLSRVAAAGGAVTGVRLSSVTTLIDNLTSSGVLSKLQYVFLPGGSDSFTGAAVPLIDTENIGNASVSYVSSEWNGQGLKASNKNVTCGFVPATHLANSYSMHVGQYLSEAKIPGFTSRIWCPTGTASGYILWYGDDYLACSMYSDGADRTVMVGSNLVAGLVLDSRLNASLHQLREPSASGTDKLRNENTTTTTETPPNGGPFELISSGVAERILCVTIGQGLTGPEYTSYSTALGTYTTARGV